MKFPNGQTVVFSAHGICAGRRAGGDGPWNLRAIDATCPLVTKVHNEVVRHVEEDRHMLLIGHAGHDEVLGTMGEAPGRITLVTSVDDVAGLDFPAERLALSTQTTLSVDETREIVAALRERFPNLIEPRKSDICYATQNRQDAVKTLVAEGIGHLLVVGSATSSNSRRLCEVAENLGVSATLIDGPEDIDHGRTLNRPGQHRADRRGLGPRTSGPGGGGAPGRSGVGNQKNSLPWKKM